MSVGSLFKKGDGTFRYDYHLKDHLGNVRCIFTDLDDDDQADIIQVGAKRRTPATLIYCTMAGRIDFNPFGMSIDGLSYRGDLENNFLYQGKERQPEALDTDDDGSPDKRFLWYDFSARYYDPQLGRWHVSDPANQHYSGYLAMANNPINSIDPDGLFADRLSFLGTTLIGMDAYKKSTWNRTHSHFEWRYDGSLVFVRRGDWVFEAEIPAVDQATSWIDAVGGGMARRELDWRVGEGLLNQTLANADAETKERAQAMLDRGEDPRVIRALLLYEMELIREAGQTEMYANEDTEKDKSGPYMDNDLFFALNSPDDPPPGQITSPAQAEQAEWMNLAIELNIQMESK
ncbi:MAG: RHS repeat-associated core domain-containing protein [Bacteroidota bacterium]|nr:RHS repeat-associated core domain-containing protein [Bacteroidota bacterium]